MNVNSLWPIHKYARGHVIFSKWKLAAACQFFLFFSWIFKLLWPMPCLMITSALISALLCLLLLKTACLFAFSSNCNTYGRCKPYTWIVIRIGCCNRVDPCCKALVLQWLLWRSTWVFDEQLLTTRYCCGISSFVAPCVHRKIYFYLKI